MVFSSTTFLLLFLPLLLATYHAVPARCVQTRNAVLLVFSLLFYSFGEFKYLPLLLGSIGFNYLVAVLISAALGAEPLSSRTRPRPEQPRSEAPDPREEEGRHARSSRARGALILGTAVNLLFLFYYKYAWWALGSLDRVAKSFGWSAGVATDAPVLPLGISFFTFHAISYLVDVYRGDTKPARNVLHFACYFAMFPHLIAGPIVRFTHVSAALDARSVTSESFMEGTRRLIIGIAKKVLIANQVALIADAAFSVPPGQLTTLSSWLGALAYTLQIYFDFSGYSDMAIGLAAMLGFRFHENFNHPYAAASMQEFWRRWHISLSAWFRDYLYFPLGGNRRGAAATLRNLTLVFFLCGLWHGASWTFVAWGLFHGAFLVAERLGLHEWLGRSKAALGHLYVGLVVVVGWVLFRSDSFLHAANILRHMFVPSGGLTLVPEMLRATNAVSLTALMLGAIGASGAPARAFRASAAAMARRSGALRLTWEAALLGYGILVTLLSSASLLASSYNPFIYFRF